MRPFIGITASYDDTERKSTMKFGYQEGVIEAGGIPFVIPPTTDKALLYEIFTRVNGLILSGGADVDPKLFGQKPLRGTGEISPLRDEMEIHLAQLALNFDKPVLGICRGCQVLNIAAGGDIFQDIYTETTTRLKHVQEAPKWYPTHEVEITDNSVHKEVFGSETIGVNSFHHQAVKELGEGFVAAAVGEDGITEAIEHKFCGYCIGVQYHPELMWEKDRKFLGLFEKLVQTCVKNYN